RARAARARRERRLLTAAAIPMPATRAPADALFDQTAAPAAVPEPLARTVAAAAPAAAQEPAEFYDAEAERVWDPVPVPLPTYVLAPRAPRSVRVIDLTRPGTWTSGHLHEDELLDLDDRTALPHGARPAADVPSGPPRDGIVTGE